MDNYISIFLKTLHVDVRIGLLEEERRAPQALEVCLEVFADPSYLANSLRGEALMDYAQLHAHIMAWQERPHTDLLETLLLDVLERAFEFSEARAVQVSIGKREIFSNAQQAGVSAHMTREAFFQRGL